MRNSSFQSSLGTVIKDHPWMANLLSLAGTLGSITLAQWSLVGGLIVMILTAILTSLNIYVTWRDKVARHRKSTMTRIGDNGATEWPDTIIQEREDRAGN